MGKINKCSISNQHFKDKKRMNSLIHLHIKNNVPSIVSIEMDPITGDLLNKFTIFSIDPATKRWIRIIEQIYDDTILSKRWKVSKANPLYNEEIDRLFPISEVQIENRITYYFVFEIAKAEEDFFKDYFLLMNLFNMYLPEPFNVHLAVKGNASYGGRIHMYPHKDWHVGIRYDYAYTGKYFDEKRICDRFTVNDMYRLNIYPVPELIKHVGRGI